MTDRLECIDDSNKPAEHPNSIWIKKGNVYSIERIDKMNMQGGTLGVVLKEIDTSKNFPYTHFDLRRFRPTQELPAEVLEEILVNELEEVL